LQGLRKRLKEKKLCLRRPDLNQRPVGSERKGARYGAEPSLRRRLSKPQLMAVENGLFEILPPVVKCYEVISVAVSADC